MTHHFNVTGAERKKLAQLIGETIGQKPVYQYMPTCAYQIGRFTLSKDGALSWADMDDADPDLLDESCNLIADLADAGFRSDKLAFNEEQLAAIEADTEVHGDEINTHGIDPVPDDPEPEAQEESTLSISLPRERFSEAAIENLKALIASKGALMKRAFLAEDLPLTVTEEQVTFPWFRLGTAEETAAFTAFIQAIGEMAINQHRISAKEKPIVNEKYEFRCFLLRLGMIGADTKKIRKTLLKNLSGSAAFKSGMKKEGELA